MEKSDNTKNLALLANNEINVSVLEVAAEGVRVKLWPNADAVRAHLEEATARLPGGLKGYSVRHYVCGRYLYCAIALGDITKDAPCPASYQVNTDSYLNEAEGSLVAAAAEWSIGKGVLALPPLRISKDRVQINPVAGRDGKTIEQYKIYPLQVGYDRYTAQYLVQDMKQYGFHMDDVFQGFNLTPVIREVEGLLKDGTINIGDNDLLKVHLLNTALKVENDSGRCKLVKMSAADHIDGCAALMDGMTVRQKWCAEIGGQLKNAG